MSWQPIETAPETTRAYLVYCPERKNQYLVIWRDYKWHHFAGGAELREAPTHWMLLPPSPEVVK